jgi:ferredoxin
LLLNTGKQRPEIIEKLKQDLKIIANDIICKKNNVEKSSFFVYTVNRMLSPKRIRTDTRLWDKEFSINESCIGCMTCQKVCQFKNIKLENKKPAFQHNCQRCMACIQYCPKNAIGFNGKILEKPRYFHPDYPSGKMIEFIINKG